MLKQKNLISVMLLGTFLVSCAPPFEAKDSKTQSQSLQGDVLGKNQNQRTTFEVPPAVAPDVIRQLPAEEQRIGTGANTVQLGQLEISESRIHRLEDGKLLRFTGKGKLRDRRFDIDISGRVDNEGKARMFPADTSSARTDIAIRGMGVCVDLVGTRFYCQSLFVEVYVRIGTETFSEQFVLRQSAQGDAAAPQVATPPQQKPSRPQTGSSGVKETQNSSERREHTPEAQSSSEAEQQAPEGLSPEQAAAETDIERENDQEASSEATDANRGGRFVGFRDEVDELFRAQNQGEQSRPEEVSPTTVPSQKPEPSTTRPAAPTVKPAPAETVAPEAAAPQAMTPVESAPAATSTTQTTVDANVQQVNAPAGGGFALRVAPAAPVRPTQQQAAVAQQQQQRPPHPAAALGAIADQARGCYNAGLGANCRAGGNLRNATELPRSGPGFRVVYPQRQMNFGTKVLVDLIVDLGRKLNQIMPGYQLIVSDMSSQFGGRYGARRDGGHQNGLEADLGYITTTSPPPLVVVVTNSFRRDIVKMDEQLAAWKHVVKSNLVSRIFVDRQVKAAFCQYTSRMPQDPELNETLRRLQHWDGHRNHWHMRLKCPASSPRCQDDFPLANRTGC